MIFIEGTTGPTVVVVDTAVRCRLDAHHSNYLYLQGVNRIWSPISAEFEESFPRASPIVGIVLHHLIKIAD